MELIKLLSEQFRNARTPEIPMSGLRAVHLLCYRQTLAFLLVEIRQYIISYYRWKTIHFTQKYINSFQIHFVNNSHNEPSLDNSGVNIHFNNKRPSNSAGVISVLLSPTVPAGAEVVIEGGCQLAQDKTLRLVSFLAHTHSLAKVWLYIWGCMLVYID